MSIKFSPQSLLVFELEVNEVCVTHGADLRVRFLYGLRAFGDLDVVEITERLVGRQCQFAVLVDALLALLGLFRGGLAADRPEGAGRQVDAELLGCAEKLVLLLAHLDLGPGVGEHVHVERERLHLLQEHLEGLGDRRLGDVLALDDRLVGLHAPDGVVGLDGEHLLERVRGAVRLERPHLHLAEALAAELRLAAQRLLGDERVRPGAPRVDLVVHEVEQLQDVHVADGDLLLERLTGAPVVELHLARALTALGALLVDEDLDRRVGVLLRVLDERLVDVDRSRAVEDRRRHRARIAAVDDLAAVPPVDLGVPLAVLVEDAVRRSPAEVRLEHLADVHAARHAERVQDDVDRAAVGEERHVLLGDDPRDDALVPVAAGELVALRDLALLRDVDTDELVHARRQVVARVARERLDVDDDAAFAVRHLEARVADLAGLLLEDGADQLLLGRQLGLALRRDLADEQVARADLGADAHDAALVELRERLLRAVRDVARDLFVAELRGARIDLVLVDVDRRKDVVLDEPLAEDDRVLEVEALERHERDEQVGPECELAVVGRAAVGEHLARVHAVVQAHHRLVVDERALVRAHELRQRVGVLALFALDDDAVGIDVDDGACVLRDDDVARVDGRAVLEAGADKGSLPNEQRNSLPLRVRAHERAVRVVVLEERDERGRDRDDLGRRDVHELDVLRRSRDGLALGGAAKHRCLEELPVLVRRCGRLRDRVAGLLDGVEVDDLVGDLPGDALGVRRLDEADLADGRVRREVADQADVRAFRRLDRAHAAVVRRVDVAHLDRRTFTGKSTRPKCAEPAAVREAGEAVRLVHELRELRGAEELLQPRDDRADVDDRLRGDGVDVLRRHPLADDALHAVEADPERFLDQLAHGAEAAVAEVLVLVELRGDRRARHAEGLGGEVLRVLRQAELHRQVDQPPDERDDVLGREDADVLRHVDAEALVQLVAADLREVVALGVEEERAQEVPRVVERRRLAGALLLEDLDQGLLLAGGGILVEGIDDVRRIVEEGEDRLVRRRVELEARRRVLGREGAEERRDRQLALPVDTGVSDALLVDLELEPRAAARHEVGREDLLRRVLRLHEVGARRTDELRDDDALGAVDDERAVLGHHREVAHEDRLLADLARLLVDEADRHRKRSLVGQVLLTALLDGELRRAEQVIGELDGERAGVVLDRRDVVDRLAKAVVQEPLERGLLDVDQVGEVEDVFNTGKRLAGAGRSDLRGQRKSLPWGRAEFRRLRACGNGGQCGRGRNVGATCQDTDEAPLHASEACGGRAGNGTDGIVAPWRPCVQPEAIEPQALKAPQA